MTGDDFASILDRHQARTATAEGPRPADDKASKASSRQDDRDERREAQPAATGTDAGRQSDASEAASKDAAGSGQLTADSSQLTDTGAPAPAVPAVPADTKVAAQQTAAEAVQAAPAVPAQAPVAKTDKTQTAVAPKQTAQGEPAAATAPAGSRQPAADPNPAPGVDAKPAEPVQPQGPQPKDPKAEPVKVEAPKASKAAAEQPAVEARKPAADAAPKQVSPDTSGKQPDSGRQAPAQQQGQPQQAAAAAPKPVQPAADSGQPTQAPSAPAAPVTRAAPQQATPVRLPQAAEAVENTIRVAQGRGVTQARLSLRPAELGGVEIHLRSTADGLVARVTADGHEAAQVLQQAGDDLRRQLQAQGIDLQRLDIGVAGDPGHGAGADAAHERNADGHGPPARGSGQPGADDGTDATEAKAGDTIELPDGVLVDVLA